jgi:hypothetical protein
MNANCEKSALCLYNAATGHPVKHCAHNGTRSTSMNHADASRNILVRPFEERRKRRKRR